MKYLDLVAACALLASGCASTSIRSVEHSSGFHSAQIHRVMIIGDFKNQTHRKDFESEFVRQWRARNVDAVSSLEVLPSSTTFDKQGVGPLAKAKGFDSVLVTHLVSRQKIEPGEVPKSSIQPSSQNEAENLNTALQVLLAPPVRTSEYDLVALQTNLYDVATQQRVWSGMSETEVIGKVSKLIPPFVKLILKNLYDTP